MESEKNVCKHCFWGFQCDENSDTKCPYYMLADDGCEDDELDYRHILKENEEVYLEQLKEIGAYEEET